MHDSTQWILGTARPCRPGICKLCFAWFCGLSPDNLVCLSTLTLNDPSKGSRVKVPGLLACRLSSQGQEVHIATSSSFPSAKCSFMHTHMHTQSPPLVDKVLWDPANALTWTSGPLSIHTLPCRQRSHSTSLAPSFAWDNFLSGSFPLPWTSLIPTHHSVCSSNVHSLRKPFPAPSHLSSTAGVLWVRGQWRLGTLSYQWAADAAWGFMGYANRQSVSIGKSAHLGCFWNNWLYEPLSLAPASFWADAFLPAAKK